MPKKKPEQSREEYVLQSFKFFQDFEWQEDLGEIAIMRFLPPFHYTVDAQSAKVVVQELDSRLQHDTVKRP